MRNGCLKGSVGFDKSLTRLRDVSITIAKEKKSCNVRPCGRFGGELKANNTPAKASRAA